MAGVSLENMFVFAEESVLVDDGISEIVLDDVFDDVVGEKPLMNFFLIERYALYGVSVRLYVRPDSLIVSRTLEQVTWGMVCMISVMLLLLVMTINEFGHTRSSD